MTHRIFVPHAPQANRALARRPLWLIVLLLAFQAYPQSAGPGFPNPGNAHMSLDNQRRLGLQAAAQVKEFRVALPVLMVLAQLQDVR